MAAVTLTIIALVTLGVVSTEDFKLGTCAKDSSASPEAVKNFRNHVPQMNLEGKCFVDCVYRLNGVIQNKEIQVAILNKFYADSRITSSCAASMAEEADGCARAAGLNACIEIKTKVPKMLQKMFHTRKSQRRNQVNEFAKRSYYYGDDSAKIPAYPTPAPLLFAEAEPVARDQYLGNTVPYQMWRRTRSRLVPAYAQRRFLDYLGLFEEE